MLKIGDAPALFSSNGLFRMYTRIVGGADVRNDDAVARCLDSLVPIVGGDFDIAYSGHRGPIQDSETRTKRILKDHRM